MFYIHFFALPWKLSPHGLLCLILGLCFSAPPQTAVAQSATSSNPFNLLNTAPRTRSFSKISPRPKATETVVPELRAAWKAKTVKKLRAFQPSNQAPRADIKTRHRGLFYWINQEALIEFEQGEWLYVITHSSHIDESVGNAILAIDHAGNLYENDAHVCGRISTYVRNGEAFKAVSEFIGAKIDFDYSWKKL